MKRVTVPDIWLLELIFKNGIRNISNRVNMFVNEAFPLFVERIILNIWYARGGLCKRQLGLTSLPTHSLIIITDWTNF